MVTYAYDKQYLNDAMKCLGEALEYSANRCKIDMDRFIEMFIVSGYAEQFESGSPKIVAGMSGIELAMNVLTEVKYMNDFPEHYNNYDFSCEYWCGWILAYYQWYSGRTFENIMTFISMADIAKMYPTLHEASEMKFLDTVNHIIKRKTTMSRLKHQRKIVGYSQKELADKAGISFRTLQQYENKSKNINKASAGVLLSLSKVLGCKIEDLLEYEIQEID